MESSRYSSDYELDYRDSSPEPFDKLPFPLHSSKPRHHHKSKRKSRARNLAIDASFFLLSNICYLLSLWPATTPREMNRRLGKIGALLVLTVVLFSAQSWLSFLKRGARYRSFVYNCIFQAGTVLAWYLFDNGNVLASHGAYNLLIFALIFVPANVLFASLYLWYHNVVGDGKEQKKRIGRFWKQFFAVLLVGGLCFGFVAKAKKEKLKYGFFGKEIPCSRAEREAGSCGSCQWDEGTPWFGLLPVRQNIFTGPMTCPNDQSFSAKFENNELVVNGCQNQRTEIRSHFNDSIIHQYSGPMYSLLPRTETWGIALKNDSLNRPTSGLQDSVLKYVESHTYPYSHHYTDIPEEIDSVFVFCGKLQPKLAYRIQPLKSTNHTQKQKDRNPKNSGLNVVTIFIDAMSRNHFHRRLPLTRKTFEELTTNLESTSELFELFRYHSVGFNTGPNTKAMWTSVSENTPPQNLNTTITAPIWEQFESKGYISARVDPMCQDWNAYYNPLSFPSTETYISPRISHEHLAYSCLPPIVPIGKSKTGNFAGPLSIMARCMSGTHVGHHVLDWSESFIRDHQRNQVDQGVKTPFFLNAVFMEAHEGSGEVLSTLDSRLSSFLDPETGSIDYNNTLVLILSDHGALMGLNNAFFENGHVEAKNPFAAVVAPRWFLEEGDGARGRRMRDVQGRLVTGFDVYEVLRGVLGVQREGSGEERLGRDFMEEEVGDRACEEVGIPTEMCKCR